MPRFAEDSSTHYPWKEPRMSNFRESEAVEYDIGKEIARGYVTKYGKEEVKSAFESMHRLMEMNPDERLKELFRKIEQKQLKQGVDGFFKGLEELGIDIEDQHKNRVSMKFKSDYILKACGIA